VRPRGSRWQTARSLSPTTGASSCARTYAETRTFNTTENCPGPSGASSARAPSPGRSGPPWSTNTRGRPPGPTSRTFPPHGHAGVAPPSLRRQHPGEGVSCRGATYQLLTGGHARGPSPARLGPRAGTFRRGAGSSCPRPTVSSRAAIIRCAASAWTRCARTGGNALILGGVELRQPPDRVVLGRRLSAETRATSIPLVSDLHAWAISRYTAGPSGCATRGGPRSLCVSTGATSSTAGRGEKALPSPNFTIGHAF